MDGSGESGFAGAPIGELIGERNSSNSATHTQSGLVDWNLVGWGTRAEALQRHMGRVGARSEG